MRVTNNTHSENMVRQIQNLATQQSKLQTQVATGQRIFQAEDDPTAVGRVLNLESEQREIAQYLTNADRALELSQATFAGLQQIKKISDRAGEIATLGAGALSPDMTRAYASELNQLLEQAVQFANTKFRNDYVFAGLAVDTPPYVVTRDAQNNITGIAYGGVGNSAAIQLSENASLPPGSTQTTNEGLEKFLNDLAALRDALSANDNSAITSVQAELVKSEDLLISSLADQGGIQTRIEANRSQQLDRRDNLEVLVSAETDTDLPSTIVKLTQAQTAYQAALQSAATMMRISLLDYIR
jgi:flagellar hook-associated protein 3 FlgL